MNLTLKSTRQAPELCMKTSAPPALKTLANPSVRFRSLGKRYTFQLEKQAKKNQFISLVCSSLPLLILLAIHVRLK